RTQDLAVPLETPRWALSTLQRSDHHDHRMAQPSQGLAVAWRQGRHGQSGAAPPDLPQPSPSRPRFNGGTAPCHKGVSKRLRRIAGNRYVRFVGEEATVTPPPYPTRCG